MVPISIFLHNQFVCAKPTGFLGVEEFTKYKAACLDARYDSKLKVQLIAKARVVEFVHSLKSAGFEVVTEDSRITDLIGDEVRRQDDLRLAADRRIQKLAEELKARNLELYAYQQDGIRWLVDRKAALLADDMGLGKGLTALLALPENAAVLVVAPAVAKGVWKRETAKWRPAFPVEVLKGRGSFRWPNSGEIIVTNYDILPEEVDKAPDNIVVICDEAHAVKNAKSQRTKRVRALTNAASKVGGYIWFLTATPLLNRPPELWSLLMAAHLAKESFETWPQFVADFNGRPGQWGGYEWGVPSPSVAAKLARVMLRRKKSEVLTQLPPKRYQVIDIELDKRSAKECDKVWKIFESKGVDLEAKDPIEALKSLQRVGFEELAQARSVLATAKIPALLELVEQFEEQEDPVVVFSAHRAPIDIFGDRPGWATITGDTPPDTRTEIERRFQDGHLRGIAATIDAGGVAITLTRAASAIFVDLDFTPALNSQAEDRIYRIGQTRGVIITQLVADHVLDHRIYEILVEKKELINTTIDAVTAKPVVPASTAATAVTQVVDVVEPVTTYFPDNPFATSKRYYGSRRAPKSPEDHKNLAVFLKITHDRNVKPTHRGIVDALSEQIESGWTDDQWWLVSEITKEYAPAS